MGNEAITSEENAHHLMVALIIIFVILGIAGSISCYFQLSRLQSVRMERATNISSLPAQRCHINELKKITLKSREEMHHNLAVEVQELREFQREVSGQLTTLKKVLAEISNKQQFSSGGRIDVEGTSSVSLVGLESNDNISSDNCEMKGKRKAE